MLALAFSVLVLIVLWMIGYAVIAVADARRSPVADLLLAPAVGVAAVVVPAFVLNRFGLPVHVFGLPLFGGLMVFAGAVLTRRKVDIPLRILVPFAVVVLGSIVLVGWPMLRHGFDWLSNGNDDGANYIVGAQRLIDKGLLQLPDRNAWSAGRYYPDAYRVSPATGTRTGAELLLALVSVVSHASVQRIFMPTIVVLHGALVAAAGALVAYRARAALVACFLTSFSSLIVFGTTIQLIGQVGGTVLLAATVIIVFETLREPLGSTSVKNGVFAGLVLTADLIFYPELLPYAVIAGFVAIVVAVKRTSMTSATFRTAIVTAIVPLFVINTYLPLVIGFLRRQLATGSHFPVQLTYFLKPSGFGSFWGMLWLEHSVTMRRDKLAVLIGVALLIGALIACVLEAWKRFGPAPIVALVMFAVAAYLCFLRQGFGVFKLAMYVQPFMLATIAGASVRVLERIVPGLVLGSLLLAAVGQPNLTADVNLVAEGPHFASGSSLSPAMKRWIEAIVHSKNARLLILDAFNPFSAKIGAAEARGTPTLLTVREFFLWPHKADPHFSIAVGLDPSLRREYGVTTDVRIDVPTATASRMNSILLDTRGLEQVAMRRCTLVSTTQAESVVNRWAQPHPAVVIAKPCSDIRDRLLLVDSLLGAAPNAYAGLSGPAGAYVTQPDASVPDRDMAGVGRDLVFRVLYPSPRARLALDISASYKGDGENHLPPTALVASQIVRLPFVGRGSARIFSEPIKPLIRLGEPLFALDMGVDGTPSPTDPRPMVAMARDISLVSQEQWSTRQPPSCLSAFPSDLFNPALEYSGIYEDGWLSEDSFVVLRQPARAGRLVLRGSFTSSLSSAPTTITMSVDGAQVAQQTVIGDAFRIEPNVPSGSTDRRVDIRFSRHDRISFDDNRQASAHVDALGFAVGANSACASPSGL